MQTYIDCYPCVLRQAIEAARMANASPSQERKIVLETLDILKSLPEGATPPAIGSQAHRAVWEITGNQDPYAGVKREATDKALSMLPELHKIIDSAEDRLETAIRISIAGNIMDFGPNQDYDLWEVIENVLQQDFSLNDLPELREVMERADNILFLGDNAGEHVFDKVLIEELPLPVTYVVRGGPILNDVTMADADRVGMDQVAEVMENGARVPGTIISMCTPEFQERFKKAELILAKGMGNYETLSEVQAPVFFLLRVKCPVIAADVGVPVGSTVIKKA